MKKLNYLNIGCGEKFHVDWHNIDMHSNNAYVRAHDLSKGLPYPDNQFDAVYHSQVLEHFSKKDALNLIKECYRVLKPGGVLRVVVPDLENIATEYLRNLKKNLENTDPIAKANYDWIMLELYDQVVRHHSGGDMVTYLQQDTLINKPYIIERIGAGGKAIIDGGRNKIQNRSLHQLHKKLQRVTLRKLLRYPVRIITTLLSSRAQKIGAFRLGGEIHLWMYDRFSLDLMLKEGGFLETMVVGPHKSAIANWAVYELDVKAGEIIDPTSLFMEAVKTH